MANICDIHKNTLGKAIKDFTDFSAETFDISGKVDTNNPIYKFYEKDLGRYLTSKYGAKTVVDKQGVKWYEVDVKKDWAKLPVEAFGVLPLIPQRKEKGGK